MGTRSGARAGCDASGDAGTVAPTSVSIRARATGRRAFVDGWGAVEAGSVRETESTTSADASIGVRSPASTIGVAREEEARTGGTAMVTE